jgi:hypothetical protein
VVEVKLTSVVVVAGLTIANGLAVAGEEDVYRWVDKSGAVVYSQVPPDEDATGEWIKVKTAPAEEKEVAEDASGQTEKKDLAKDPVLDEEERKEYCDAGRQNLKLLEESGLDASFSMGDGEPVKFTPEEREQKIKEAKAVIEAYCDEES